MDLVLAEKMAVKLIKEHLPEYKFEWNKRLSAFGVCSYRKKTIYLSVPLTEVSKEESVWNTIIHEIAHGLTPGHSHDWVWRQKFISMGGDGKRCGCDDSFEDKEAAQNILIKKTNSYLICDTCNNKTPKSRKPKRPQSCGKCCSRFNEKYILRFVSNNEPQPNAPVFTKPSIPTIQPLTSRVGLIDTVISMKGSTISIQNGILKTDRLQQADKNFVVRVVNFINDFRNMFPNADVNKIIKNAQYNSTSWRNFSTQIRKEGDRLVGNVLISRADYQSKFFYEGVMIDRKIHGANAPWI